MEKEFIPYEQALALKELGFDEPCFGYYYHYYFKDKIYFEGSRYDVSSDCHNLALVKAPLYQQAFRWFREKQGMLVCIEFVEPEYGGDYGYKMYYKPGHLHIDHWNKGFQTYEEAEQACLDKLIEIVNRIVSIKNK